MSYRNRRRLFAAGLALIVGGAAFLYYTSSRLTVVAYNRLKFGMTLAEVEATLGVTRGQYLPIGDRVWTNKERETIWVFDLSAYATRSPGTGAGFVLDDDTGEVVAEKRCWEDGDHQIWVFFRDGRMVSKFHLTTMPRWEVWLRRQLTRQGF